MGVFAKRLKEIRTINNLSQQVVADFCGVSQSMLARYEAGECKPSYIIMCKLSAYFAVSSDYLLGLSDERRNIEQNYFHTYE